MTAKKTQDADGKLQKLLEQRNNASKKYAGKVVGDGGMWVTVLLEKEHAEPFAELVKQHGSKKQAFVYLLTCYQQGKQD